MFHEKSGGRALQMDEGSPELNASHFLVMH